MKLVLFLHAAATLYMVGLIWFVQVVHYPLLASVGVEGYPAYQEAHSRCTTWVVAPAMLLEVVTAFWLLVARPASLPVSLVGAGLALLVLAWVSTWALQVPQHAILERGFDAAAHAKLVSSNWIRTAAWSARGVLVLNFLWRSSS